MASDASNFPFRLKYFLSHLAISILVFAVFVGAVLTFWYPIPYFWTEGGYYGLGVATFVDLVMGPLLTLCIAKETKSRKALIFDLVVIGALQIGALGYGLNLVYKERPIAVYLFLETFHVMRTEDLANIGKTPDDLKSLGKPNPHFVFVREPATKKEAKKTMRMVIENQIDIQHQIYLWQPLAERMSLARERAIDVAEFKEGDPEAAAKLEAFAKRHKGSEEVFFYRFTGKFTNTVLAFNGQGEPIGYVDVEPPPPPIVTPPVKDEVPPGIAAPEAPKSEAAPAPEGEPGDENAPQNQN